MAQLLNVFDALVTKEPLIFTVLAIAVLPELVWFVVMQIRARKAIKQKDKTD